MVRSYNRHGAVEAFGVIASNTSNSIFDGKVAYVPACEDVLVCRCKVLFEEQSSSQQADSAFNVQGT